jgi:hypothetical protein
MAAGRYLAPAAETLAMAVGRHPAGAAPTLAMEAGRHLALAAPSHPAGAAASRTEETGDRQIRNRETADPATVARDIRQVSARTRPGDSAEAPCRRASPRTRTR